MSECSIPDIDGERAILGRGSTIRSVTRLEFVSKRVLIGGDIYLRPFLVFFHT